VYCKAIDEVYSFGGEKSKSSLSCDPYVVRASSNDLLPVGIRKKERKDADHAIINHFAFFQAANDVSIQDNKTRNNSL